jgi:integrase
MANLGQKDGIYHIRFRFGGREYKKSLRIRNRADAEAARNLAEVTIHRLHTGQTTVPDGVDTGDFITSGGTLEAPPSAPGEPDAEPVALPSTRTLTDAYGESVRNIMAPSYHYSQMMHLRHLLRFLGGQADVSCDQVTFHDLDRYLKKRLGERHENTAERERITLMQFYKWVVQQKHLAQSPAVGLTRIVGGEDPDNFKTLAEIKEIIERGGLSDEEVLGLWECLYLNPKEIAGLLATVRRNAQVDYSYLLHAIPAYTGMRRGEVLRFRWLDVSFTDNYITARSRKQSRRKKESTRQIDLHPELKKELLAWRDKRPRGQLVICDVDSLEPINNDRANRCFWGPMRHTEWCLNNARHWFKVGFHSYRHSFASNLAAAGVDQRIIDRFMGHQTEAMRKRYQHLFPNNRRSAIESFSLTGITGCGETGES